MRAAWSNTSTNIELLKPADMARGNRILLFEVNNRGNKLALANFNEGVAGGVADRNALSSPGDGWLMRAGYTMVWFGWEMDVRPGMSRIGMPPIAAHNHDGAAITGVVRSEIITPAPAPACRSSPASRSRTIRPTATIAIRRRASTIGPRSRTAFCRLSRCGRASRIRANPFPIPHGASASARREAAVDAR